MNRPTIRLFTEKDSGPNALEGERVALLGYGNLGRSMALNLCDSGIAPLVVGNVADEFADAARDDGFTVLPIAEAVANATIVLILLPDEVIPEAYSTVIAPHLATGSSIVFASGYTLAYGLVKPSPAVDVLLLAPRMAGENARQRYKDRRGFFAYISVEQDASGKGWARLLGLARAAGVLWSGALELDARREADLDLFIEQTLGAAVGVAIMSAFSLGVEAGIPPEALVMEMYMSQEMETVWRSFREKGFFRASDTHGPTALYGGYLRTMQLMQSDLGAKFRETLDEIQSGEFARQFQAERESGYPTLSLAQQMTAESSPVTGPIAQAEARLRTILDSS